jgi:hypothetical protein
MNDKSSDTKVGSNNNNKPNHFIVLEAIARGIKEIDRLAKATRLPRDEVQLIINDLSFQRLIIKEEKKRRFFLGGKKLEIKVTDTGLKMLNSKRQELHQQAEQLRQWQKSGNTTQLQSYMDSNRSWIPFMLFSGIMDMLFFTSMMSMIGMTLNPMESQMAAESSGVGGEEKGTGETESTGSSETGESNIADTGGDFGGFDGGGFGDF